jgi:hypothetical protein
LAAKVPANRQGIVPLTFGRGGDAATNRKLIAKRKATSRDRLPARQLDLSLTIM